MLTKKCLEHFLRDSKDSEDEIFILDELFLSSLILQWFDNTFIDIDVFRISEKFGVLVNNKKMYEKDLFFNTRLQATISAIKFSNDLYNKIT